MENGARSEREDGIYELVGRVIALEGLELVDLALRGAGGRRVLRVDIDRPGPDGVGLADCQRVSQALGPALDEADLIGSGYLLEVSSPGADRPIRSEDDYRRNTGRRIVVTAADPTRAESRTRSFHGRLLGCEGGCVVLSGDENEEIRIPLDGIVKAQQELPL